MYSGVQHAHVPGVIWIQDTETTKTGEVLLLWLDQRAQPVRSVRVHADEVNGMASMLSMSADQDSP